MSDDNIVTFPGNEPEDDTEYVLVCMKCTNRTFNLYAGGKVTCAGCDVETILHGADEDDIERWRAVVGEPSDKSRVKAQDSNEVVSKQFNSIPLARAQTMKRIHEWDKDDTLVMLIAYCSTGEGRHWFDIVTEEQRAWVMEKFAALAESIKTMDISMPSSERIFPKREDADGAE